MTPSLPVSNLKELIAYAKSNPDVLNFASTGSGTANHLAVEMLSKQAGVKVATVFYKGSMEGIADVIGGRTHAMFAPATSVIPQVQAGKLKAIAVTEQQPHLACARCADHVRSGPARLRGDDVERSVRAGRDAARASSTGWRRRRPRRSRRTELQSKIKSNGGDPIVMGPKEFEEYLQKDIRRWSDAITAAGIKPQ